MHVNRLTSLSNRYIIPLFTALLFGVIGLKPTAAHATTTNVNVGDNFFSPATVSIKAGDTVQWTWTGNSRHSSTSTASPKLWDSDVFGKGHVFTNTFDNVGSFPYRCTIHGAQQSGTVKVVAAANQPPTVNITSPASGAVFAAPWTGTIMAAVADSDGTVSKIDFYLANSLLSSVNNPGPNPSGSVSNLPAGSYSLKAVATDNLGGTNTSAVVSVNVLEPAPITLSNAERISPTAFQFNYSATPGLSYVVKRTSDFLQWTALATNIATNSSSSFLDTNADGPLNLYSVSLLPNP
jgi:plastocyanin